MICSKKQEVVQMNNILKYSYPAKNFQEALPVGNGFLGGHIYGGTKSERIVLNESTFWAGNPKEDIVHGSPEIYQKARMLALQGKFYEAQTTLESNFSGDYPQRYLPLADLTIESNIDDVTNYKRTLNMETAIHTTTFECDGASYCREVFVSHPDNIMVVKLSSDKVQEIIVGYNSVMQNCVIDCDNLFFSTIAPVPVKNYVTGGFDRYSDVDEEKGIRAIAGIKVITDGTYKIINNKAKISGKEIILLVSAQTSYVDYKTQPFVDGKDEYKLCVDAINCASKKTFEELKNVHVEDFSSLYNRTILSLSNDDSQKDTDVLLNENKDNSIYTLMYNYGKYLTISASREDSLAMSLQGLWNEKLFPPWGGDHHLNINAEMNYMPTLRMNLDECFIPYINFVKNLAHTGRTIAKEWFGIDGIIVNHTTDVWCLANPTGQQKPGNSTHSYFPVAFGWLLQGLYDRYLTSNDSEYLKETLYPLLEEYAETLIQLLYTDEDGKMFLCPATSPENNYIIAEETFCSVGKHGAMFNSITRDVFRMASEAAKILNLDEKSKKYSEYQSKIMPLLIGSDGRILEWDREVVERDINHRHVSHLYSLHPLKEITPYGTPELAEACKKSLNMRGDEGTGWCVAWKANMWARLHDGERALKLLNSQLSPVDSSIDVIKLTGGGTYPNLFCAHPPFQIDGNFGFASAIIEMLVQCNGKDVYLLPAVPKKWQNGSFKGVKLDGGATIDFSWENGAVTDYKIHPETMADSYNIITKQ